VPDLLLGILCDSRVIFRHSGWSFIKTRTWSQALLTRCKSSSAKDMSVTADSDGVRCHSYALTTTAVTDNRRKFFQGEGQNSVTTQRKSGTELHQVIYRVWLSAVFLKTFFLNFDKNAFTELNLKSAKEFEFSPPNVIDKIADTTRINYSNVSSPWFPIPMFPLPASYPMQ